MRQEPREGYSRDFDTGSPGKDVTWLFSRDLGHPSRTQKARSRVFAQWSAAQLGPMRAAKTGELVVRQGNEEGLEDYKGLAEAGIQVEMGRIHDGPEAVRALHRSQRQFRGGIREVAVKVHDYFMECRKLVQELGALGEQNAAE